MHFAAFSWAIVTKQRVKQLLAWWHKWTAVRTQINYMNTVQWGQGEVGANELGFGPGKRTKCVIRRSGFRIRQLAEVR